MHSMHPRAERSPVGRAASVRAMLCLTLCLAAVSGCGSGGGDSGVTPPNNTVDKVVVDPLEVVVAAGATSSLTARALNSAGNAITGTGVQWATSDANVATVSTV